MGHLNDLGEAALAISVEKGHWEHRYVGFAENPSIFPEQLMLIVTEVSEAMEARRDMDDDLEAEEIADVVIRSVQYAAARGFDLDQAVADKMAKNEKRPYKHGRAR